MSTSKLKVYESKRNLTKSGEPKAIVKSLGKGNIYSIQEHNALLLHDENKDLYA